MAVKIIHQEEFEKEVLQSSTPVLADFFATWCMPCKMLAPVLEQVGLKMEGKVSVVKLDIDENMDLARKYGVMSVPTMIVFKGGEEAERMVGYRQANQIVDTLENHLE